MDVTTVKTMRTTFVCPHCFKKLPVQLNLSVTITGDDPVMDTFRTIPYGLRMENVKCPHDQYDMIQLDNSMVDAYTVLAKAGICIKSINAGNVNTWVQFSINNECPYVSRAPYFEIMLTGEETHIARGVIQKIRDEKPFNRDTEIIGYIVANDDLLRDTLRFTSMTYPTLYSETMSPPKYDDSDFYSESALLRASRNIISARQELRYFAECLVKAINEQSSDSIKEAI